MNTGQDDRVQRVTSQIMSVMDCFNPSKFEGKVREILTRELAENVVKSYGDLICRCGNNPSDTGFQPCLPDGTVVEPTAEGPWEGKLYVCGDCGRIIDQETCLVTGRVS
jgi:hypothetical protein